MRLDYYKFTVISYRAVDAISRLRKILRQGVGCANPGVLDLGVQQTMLTGTSNIGSKDKRWHMQE